MTKIEAIVWPSTLGEIQDAIRAAGVRGITVTDVTGFGSTAGKNPVGLGSASLADRATKVKIEVVVPDGFVRQVVEAIDRTGEAGRIRDGRVCALEVQEAVRIRTGERGHDVV